MQGLILAAGMGKRLQELTKNNTKCMVEVNGISLIERALRSLDKLELSRIVIVIGYEGNKLIDFINTLNIKTKITYIENGIYYKTNNIYSLSLAKNYLLDDDTLLLESDLIFEDSVLTELLDDERDTLALVDKYQSWMDGTCMKINDNDFITDFISSSDFDFYDSSNYYKTVNIYKFSKDFSKKYYVPFLEAYIKALGYNEYYEQVLKIISMLPNNAIQAKRLTGQKWYEIDDVQDLDIASSLFSDDKSSVMSCRYGGYWRYPELLDFCYLVNPYFPPKKLKDELMSNFDTLLTQYPSGELVNASLAARNFEVNKDYIIVGNGASELIYALMSDISDNVGFIRPTFEEYPNRLISGEQIIFIPDNDDFKYDADDIMQFFDDKDISYLVLINPDNPTGNYIQKSNILKLIRWCKDKSIMIILDESFVDFADEDNSSLLYNHILEQFDNLIVIKSISKSYGVPGLRLGVLATSNKFILNKVKSNVSIWNINSFAEFYMQIYYKYRTAYFDSLRKIKMTRHKMMNKLSKINNIHVIPSQANYFLIELTSDKITSHKLTNELLDRNIFVKDASKKINNGRQYIRVAIRNEEENDILCDILNNIL